MTLFPLYYGYKPTVGNGALVPYHSMHEAITIFFNVYVKG